MLIQAILAHVIMLAPCFAFAPSKSLEAKSVQSDVIIRGIVLDIVTVAGEAVDSRGGTEDVLEGDWTGPSSVAVVRVVSVLKGDSKKIPSVVFVPCGYSFDESPCELTTSKDYIFFLESMGRRYFHPLDPYCMHRVQDGLVGMSGFDWDEDFEADERPESTMTLQEFVARIEEAIATVGEQE